MLYVELFISFALVGFSSFGGLSMVPLIHDQMLSHGWMTAQEVADIVAIAEMTPGPLGLNCATFAGSRTAGLPGAICASAGVLLPAVTVGLIAAMFLKRFKESRGLSNALFGIRPVCIGMISAVIVQQSISNYAGTALAGVSLQAIGIGIVAAILLIRFRWSVPRTILVSALLGLLLG